MRLALLFSGCTALALVGCGPPANLQQTQQATNVDTGACNAQIYSFLIGEPIGTVYTLNTGVNTRVLGADEFVTRDFDPNRLTFTTTRDDTIGRVFCG